MAIITTFPAGKTHTNANGLHQWDRGQQLEIHDATLPAAVETHFACAGMRETIKVSGAPVDGVLTVAIPDSCLEQPSPVTAWICADGTTLRTVTLPIIERLRPQP